MKVFVVMGNDYPAAVFTTSEAADAYCEARRKADQERDRQEGVSPCFGPRIFWRAYGFELQEAANV